METKSLFFRASSADYSRLFHSFKDYVSAWQVQCDLIQRDVLALTHSEDIREVHLGCTRPEIRSVTALDGRSVDYKHGEIEEYPATIFPGSLTRYNLYNGNRDFINSLASFIRNPETSNVFVSYLAGSQKVFPKCLADMLSEGFGIDLGKFKKQRIPLKCGYYINLQTKEISKFGYENITIEGGEGISDKPKKVWATPFGKKREYAGTIEMHYDGKTAIDYDYGGYNKREHEWQTFKIAKK